MIYQNSEGLWFYDQKDGNLYGGYATREEAESAQERIESRSRQTVNLRKPLRLRQDGNIDSNW